MPTMRMTKVKAITTARMEATMGSSHSKMPAALNAGFFSGAGMSSLGGGGRLVGLGDLGGFGDRDGLRFDGFGGPGDFGLDGLDAFLFFHGAYVLSGYSKVMRPSLAERNSSSRVTAARSVSMAPRAAFMPRARPICSNTS